MPQITIGQRFVDNGCSPVVDSSYPTHGTVTKSTIAHLVPTDLDTLFKSGGLFADLDAWFFHSIEMMACGTLVYAWYDWIMANAERMSYHAAFQAAVKGTSAVRGPGLLQPFVLGRQNTVMNRDYWYLENSIRIADYTVNQTATGKATMTAGPLTSTSGGVAVVRVSSRHGMPMDASWFLPRQVIHVFTRTASVSQQGNWKVVDAAVDDNLTYIDILVADENAGSSTPYFNLATTGASSKNGVIIPGINNVNDFEAWCHNQITIDGKKMVPFWFQTYRMARRVDSEYDAVFNRLMESNRAFKEFGDLDMAERNAQDELMQKKAFVNAFFFQKPISANQTMANWQSLEAINTVTEVDLKPGLGGKIQARRANWIGVKEQLRQCDRVVDLQGNPLALNEWFKANYDIARARRTSGKKALRLDWFTNAMMRDKIHQAMIAYYKSYYQDTLRFTVELGGNHNELGFIFDVYKVQHPASVEIAVISSDFFDDWYDEHVYAGEDEAGNILACLDIGKPGPTGGSIYYAQVAMNRKQYSTAKIEELARLDQTFRCVMETIREDVTLTSETGMPIVECPKHSFWMEGMAMTAPVLTGSTASYADYY